MEALDNLLDMMNHTKQAVGEVISASPSIARSAIEYVLSEYKYAVLDLGGIFLEKFREDSPTRWKDLSFGIKYEKNPIIFLHGLFQNRGIYIDPKDRMEMLGFPIGYRLNYNPYADIRQQSREVIDKRVDQIIKQVDCATGKVDIIGFSLGGLVARYYAQKHPDKVDHCVMLATPHNGTNLAYAGLLLYLARIIPGIRLNGTSFSQMLPESNFLKDLNSMEPHADKVKYINIYLRFDQAILGMNVRLPFGINKEIAELDVRLKGRGHLAFLHDHLVIDAVARFLKDEFENNENRNYS